jgi:cytochrome P450
LPSLLAGLNIFASKGVKARQYLFGRFQEYLKGNYSDAAEVTKERVKVMSEYGILADDTARMTLSFGIALLSNTAPTAFWTLYNIYSQPALLQELRSELEENAVTKSKPTTAADADFEVDVAAIKTKCPLLLSIFEETQRTLTIHANIRKVLEDTVLDKYCLKKGNYVQIPNAPIHRNTELWGADANNFNSHRFVKSDSVELASSLPPHAFLAWGTAPHLCPARQFASTEILVMAALLALKVEVEPVGHNWVKPETAAGELVVILPPKKDFDVKMKPRQGWEGKWSIKIGESKTQVKLASG